MELEPVCRTCLSRTGTLHSIHNPAAPSANITLAEVLGKFMSIKPYSGDGLPQKICLSCICDITYLYNFTLKCEESDRSLRQLSVACLPMPDDDVLEDTPDDFGQLLLTQFQGNGTESEAEDGCGGGSSSERGGSIFEPTVDVKTEPSSEVEDNGELFSYYSSLPCEPEPMNYYDNTTVVSELKVLNAAIKEERLDEDSEDDIPISHLSVLKASGVLLPTTKHDYDDDYAKANYDDEVNVSAGANDVESSRQWTEGRLRRKCRIVNTPMKTESSFALTHSKHLKRFQRRFVKEKAAKGVEPKHTFVCELCNAGFASKNAIALHRRRKICTVIQHECHRCGRFFASAQHLCDHMVLYAIPCDQCDNHFSTLEELDTHTINTHIQKRDFVCDICHKRFSFYSGLKAHKRIHTDERPFQCKTCGKRFQQKGNMKLHQIRHGGTKPFHCEQCPKRFFLRSELALHERSHTSERPYKCDICGKGYLSSNQLSNHRRGHTGERPYACELCPSRFRLLSTLKSHHRTHTGEKPFQCKYCSRRFSDKSNCRIHEKKHPQDSL